MFEESVFTIPSILAFMNSWLTPAVFFVVINVVIGTIAFTSTLANKKQHNHHQDSPTDLQHQQKLTGSSSPLLQRLKSIKFSSYRSPEAPSLKSYPKKSADSEPLFNFGPASQSHYVSSPQIQEKLGSFAENPQEKQGNYFSEQNPSESCKGNNEFFAYQVNRQQKSPENDGTGEETHICRSKSDTMPVAGEIPKKLPAKMKKSASLKSAFKHFEAEDILEARRPATVRERSSTKAVDVDEGVDAKADDFINKFKHQLKLQRLDSIIRYKEIIGKGSKV